jgi:predicted nucleotidyltransferase
MIKLIELLNEYTLNDTLNPKVWDNGKIKPKLLSALIKIAKKFYQDLKIDAPIEDIILTGSSANYNWTDFSDIDVHILIDFSKLKDPELATEYFDAKKDEFTVKYNLKYQNHPIELYVQNTSQPHFALGMYSLLNNSWIKTPKKENIDIPDSEIDKKAQPLITKINNLLSDPSATVQDIKQLKSKIKQFRQSGLEDKGEYSLENLAFKKLRNEGYLQKLKDLEIKITTQSFDLNEKTNN